MRKSEKNWIVLLWVLEPLRVSNELKFETYVWINKVNFSNQVSAFQSKQTNIIIENFFKFPSEKYKIEKKKSDRFSRVAVEKHKLSNRYLKK